MNVDSIETFEVSRLQTSGRDINLSPSLLFCRNMKNVLKLSEQELRSSSKVSWHDQYRHSAWVFVGGLPYDLTEGDIICVFSQ